VKRSALAGASARRALDLEDTALLPPGPSCGETLVRSTPFAGRQIPRRRSPFTLLC